MADVTDDQKQVLSAALARQGIYLPGDPALAQALVPQQVAPAPNPIASQAAQSGLAIPGLQQPQVPIGPPPPPPRALPGAAPMRSPAPMTASLPTSRDTTPISMPKGPVLTAFKGTLPTVDTSGVTAPGAPANNNAGAIFATRPTPPRHQPEPVGGMAGGWVQRVRPEDLQAMNAAQAERVAAVQNSADTAAYNSAQVQALLKNHAAQIGAAGVDAQFKENARQREAQAKWDDLQNERERYDKMEVTPAHFWASKTTGEKIMLLIGQAAANAVAGMRGQPQYFNQQINALIDQDLDAQRANIAKAKGSLENSRSLYADMMRKFGDQRQAEAATRQVMVDQLGKEAAAMTAQTGSDTAQAASKQQIADLHLEQAKMNASAFGMAAAGAGAAKPNLNDLKWLAEHTEAPRTVVDTTSSAMQDVDTESGKQASGLGFHYLSGIPGLGHMIYSDATYASDEKFKLAVAKGATELGRGNPAATQFWMDQAERAHSPQARKALLLGMQQMAQSQIATTRSGVMPETVDAQQALRTINSPPPANNQAPFQLLPATGTGNR